MPDAVTASRSTRVRAAHLLVMLYAALGPLLVLRGIGPAPIGLPDLLFLPALFLIVTIRTDLTPALSWFYVGFLGVALASAVANTDGWGPVLQVVRIAAIFVPFLLVFRLPSIDRPAFKTIVKGAYFGGMAAVLIGIAFYYLGIEMHDAQQRIWLGNGQGSRARAGGLLGNTGGFGHLTATWGLVAMLLSQMAFDRRRGLAFATGAGFTTWALLLSASRGAFLHVFVGLVVGLPLLIRVSRTVRTAIPVALGALVLLSSSVIPATMLPTSGFVRQSWLRLDLFNISGESEFFQSVRFANWPDISRTIDDHPLLGTGIKQFHAQTGTFIDNSFLAVLVETGLIGGSLFIAFWVVLVIRLSKQTAAGSRPAHAALALAVAEISHAATADTFSLWYSMPLTFLLIAVCMKHHQTTQQAVWSHPSESVVDLTPSPADELVLR